MRTPHPGDAHYERGGRRVGSARLTLPGETVRVIPADELPVPPMQSLIAALVASISGYAVVRTGGAMMRSGVSVQDGGSWTVLLILEMTVNLAAVGVALS